MSTRPAAVAGQFYPADTDALTTQITGFLAAASSDASMALPRAIIVPHAGYIYSGLTAAFAYQAIAHAAFQRVALFGPVHRVAFYGMAVPQHDRFQTPLGDIVINREAIAQLLNHAQVQNSDAAHAQEHSLEVQLPFLQTVLDSFELVPVCVGMVEPEAVAEVIAPFLADPDTLTVISSDLSHFHHYQQANALDAATLEQICSIRAVLNHEQACGATAVNALLLLAEEYKLTPRLLDYRNSGDSAGDKNRVVGYASLAWMAQERGA